NGNMTTDRNKGITSIAYNPINLPTRVVFENLDPQYSTTWKAITYTYDATGVKLQKTVQQGSIGSYSTTHTKYATHYIYVEDATGETLTFFNHPEGYVEPNTGNGYDYVYQYKDHLGNIRLSYKNTGTGSSPNLEILEENNYYPFGLEHKGYGAPTVSEHPYKYNGKELNKELGLDWYDYGARNYDAAIGRWMNLDPLAEMYDDNSPYAYVKNNPIYYVDPDGMKIDLSDIFRDERGLKMGIQLLLDLSEQTGLSLTVNKDDGLLQYDKDENGNAKVHESNGVQLGSDTARSSLIASIDHKDTVVTELTDHNTGSGVPKDARGNKENKILLDPTQIGSQISNTSEGLNPKTMGFGMTFMHELFHTPVGGNLSDPSADSSSMGETVTRVNTIRKELDANPLNVILSGNGYFQYGIRKYYVGEELSRTEVNSRMDEILMQVRFTILNENGRSKGASTKSNVIKRKN